MVPVRLSISISVTVAGSVIHLMETIARYSPAQRQNIGLMGGLNFEETGTYYDHIFIRYDIKTRHALTLVDSLMEFELIICSSFLCLAYLHHCAIMSICHTF